MTTRSKRLAEDARAEPAPRSPLSDARAHRPVPAAPPDVNLPPVHRRTLSNGLEVLIVERNELPVIDARLVIRGGAYGDDPAHAGRAFMLGEVLDQGTASRSATDIADAAELIGATLATRATWDAMVASLHVLSPRLEQAIALLADVIVNATFPDEEVERKRSERLAAILHENDEPRVLATQEFNRQVWPPDHPYAAPLAGTRDSIDALGRRDIVQRYDDLFAPGNAFLVMVGDTDPDRAVPLLERYFGGWADRRIEPGRGYEVLPQKARALHIVGRPGAPQSELRIGLPGPRRDTSDFFALLVANTVLGGAFTSRLNMRLREEKAYTYGAGSTFAFRVGGGPFMAVTAVGTAATADAVAVTVEEIARLARERVPSDELDRAKQYIVLGLPRTFEITADIAEHVVEMELYGLGEDYYDRYVEEIEAVTVADVQDAAARWLNVDGLTIAIAGDAAAISAELEALKMGPVHISVPITQPL